MHVCVLGELVYDLCVAFGAELCGVSFLLYIFMGSENQIQAAKFTRQAPLPTELLCGLHKLLLLQIQWQRKKQQLAEE